MVRTIALLLAVSAAFGQTRVAPRQVKNWRQVSRLDGFRYPTTSIRVGQLLVPADFLSSWEQTARLHVYHHYRIALVDSQKEPILITCAALKDACDDSLPLWYVE